MKLLLAQSLNSINYERKLVLDYETISGYIIKQIGRIPNKNEHLFLPIGQVLIKKASSRRIEQVQIYTH